MERVSVWLILSAYGDPGPPKLFDGDEGLLEVRVFGENVRAEVEREMFRHENVVRNFGQV